MNINQELLGQLSALNLSHEEAQIYLVLLKQPATHLKLARQTGINRTKVYRLVEQLIKRSLVSVRTDDRGSFLVAADPASLEVELVTQEETLKSQRHIFASILPQLEHIQSNEANMPMIHTYDGTEGFKQMLWHELKAEKELLTLGKGNIKDLVSNHRWAEKHRAMTVAAGYNIRQIHNPSDGVSYPFTINQQFMDQYSYRLIDENILLLKQQTTIYNDTVATYYWRHEKRVGIEITDTHYAHMWRQLYEYYWSIARPATSKLLGS